MHGVTIKQLAKLYVDEPFIYPSAGAHSRSLLSASNGGEERGRREELNKKNFRIPSIGFQFLGEFEDVRFIFFSFVLGCENFPFHSGQQKNCLLEKIKRSCFCAISFGQHKTDKKAFSTRLLVGAHTGTFIL
jgi:hypothetical protein